ncbi:sugar ABC transporter ATP-binding protein [Nordella sp. HKS 07]|uniref:sugar ABC transporter ATP-binding protein n=1 Tax=Nordella sp. HKS 07 TaxID=2712222 RepID=UPI0013E1B706|nr:sugar ABC transporter ATP-binding protein [Nordella sp. HKS 07]QIG47755.1 sugar ABC transporter ATP-binding protein [Nordella sp. HKS 07]
MADANVRMGEAVNGAGAALPRMPVLSARGVSKRFAGVKALDDVSLDIEAGRAHALIGQNGAGKSTLINILSGMFRADAGEIHMEDRPVVIDGTRHALTLGIATVYQELSLLPNLTVEQNLALGREPRRGMLLDRQAMRDKAARALGRLGLAITPDMPVARLSLAERQMVEITKALADDPKLLILDEPTAPLGPGECAQLFAAIARLKAQGVAILYVSHRFAEVLGLCETATILRDGRRVLSTGLAGWSEDRLTDAMLGTRSQRYEGVARQTGDVVLKVNDLHLRPRVRGVSFTARRAEIVALAGLLGAGQNEIGRVIGGDLRPDKGSVEIDGTGVGAGDPRAAVTAGICLLTEERKAEGILPNRPLSENIAVASLERRRGVLGFVKATAERDAVAQASKLFGVVAASPDAPMRTLSGGNQQKALLARWDLAKARVFVLIEPTRGVDVGARADIYRRLDALARQGASIILISSDLPEVLALADRILIVRAGRIVAETAPVAVDEERLNLLIQEAAVA